MKIKRPRPLTPEIKFKQLQKKWYAKLKDTGFNDIEYKGDYIESAVPKPLRGKGTATVPDKFYQSLTEEYYTLCSQFLNDFKFERPFDKRVWELHTEGFSIREIATSLKTKKRRKSTIWTIVKKLETEMKRRYLSK